jgi:hypothetical protein
MIVVGARTWKLRSSERDPDSLVFEPAGEHNYFFGQVFESAPTDASTDEHDRYPGVPIAPAVLSRGLRLCITKLKVRFKGSQGECSDRRRLNGLGCQFV